MLKIKVGSMLIMAKWAHGDRYIVGCYISG